MSVPIPATDEEAPRRIWRLPQLVRTELIRYLLEQEDLSGDEAVQAAKDWNATSDHELIRANNYNRVKNGLPPRQFNGLRGGQDA